MAEKYDSEIVVKIPVAGIETIIGAIGILGGIGWIGHGTIEAAQNSFSGEALWGIGGGASVALISLVALVDGLIRFTNGYTEARERIRSRSAHTK